MEKKDITYADVSRSLNRLEGFIDDNLLGIQPYSEGHNDIKDVTRLIDAVKYNREGDEEISYIGIYDCVDFVLNNTSMPLAKRIFAIESKIKEVEPVLLSYCHDSMIKVVSDLLWETGRILWQIGELYVEPFIQESTQTDTIPETGNIDTGIGCINQTEGDDGGDDDGDESYPNFDFAMKKLFKTEDKFNYFCEESKGLNPEDVASLYCDMSGVLNPRKRGVGRILYDTFINPKGDDGIVVYETFLRYLRESERE